MPTKFQPDDVEKIVLVSIALHNYLRQIDHVSYTLLDSLIAVMAIAKIVPGQWNNNVNGNTFQTYQIIET